MAAHFDLNGLRLVFQLGRCNFCHDASVGASFSLVILLKVSPNGLELYWRFALSKVDAVLFQRLACDHMVFLNNDVSEM